MRSFSEPFRVEPGSKIRLAKIDPNDTLDLPDKKTARKLLKESTAELATLQHRLFAENKRALLIVFQAMDAGGKDGTIRQVMSGLNPQSCRVKSFKAPSQEELSHGFLWRIHRAIPAKGEIGIFNRSHYEDVLIVRVHNLVPKPVWSKRYRQINDFEGILAENNIQIVKFFLHIDKDEQKKRFQRRIDNPDKMWKVEAADFSERKHWDDYEQAYEAAIAECSTDEAPWYIIPANNKWFRNLAVSRILVETLRKMNPKFPEPKIDVGDIVIE